MEANGIGGLIKLQGIGTIALYLEDNKGKMHNPNFKNVYYFPGRPRYSPALRNGPKTEGKSKLAGKRPT